MTHLLKIRADFADRVLSGEKTFELRKNDRDFQCGDEIVFQVVWLSETAYEVDEEHPLNGKPYTITYVLSGWGLKKGYVALGIKPGRDDIVTTFLSDFENVGEAPGMAEQKYLCDRCARYPCSDNPTKLMKYCPEYEPKPKPTTNADRIRAMSDEELAQFIERSDCPPHDGICDKDNITCSKCWLDWLQSPAGGEK